MRVVRPACLRSMDERNVRRGAAETLEVDTISSTDAAVRVTD